MKTFHDDLKAESVGSISRHILKENMPLTAICLPESRCLEHAVLKDNHARSASAVCFAKDPIVISVSSDLARHRDTLLYNYVEEFIILGSKNSDEIRG